MKIVGLLLGAALLWMSGVIYGAWSESILGLDPSTACGDAGTASTADAANETAKPEAGPSEASVTETVAQ